MGPTQYSYSCGNVVLKKDNSTSFLSFKQFQVRNSYHAIILVYLKYLFEKVKNIKHICTNGNQKYNFPVLLKMAILVHRNHLTL